MPENQEQPQDPVAEAKAKKIEADAMKTKAESEMILAEAEKLKNENKLSELERAKFRAEIEKLARDADKAQQDDQRTNTQDQLVQQYSKSIQEQANSGWGIRQFVRDSLLGIMGGVDDAAAKGKTRALRDGLEGYLPSVTAIGAASSGDQQVERVDFDMAVTVVEAKRIDSETNSEVSAGFKIAFPISSALVSLGAGGSRHRGSAQASSNSSEQANRIRFSVPIIYATQDESPDDD